MNKKIITGLVALILAIPTMADAKLKNTLLPTPTIAILDSAIDTSLPLLANKIIYEVCVVELPQCPNGQTTMEGPGSASLPNSIITKNGFDHGTTMSSIAVTTNPNINIVFVRIIGNDASGARSYAGEPTVYNALNWVLANKDKFNIQAVAMAQGTHALGAPGTDYCPKRPTAEASITALKNAGIPVFFPAGNVRDLKRIDWPACIPDSIAMGASMSFKEIAPYSNYDAQLIDFYALGSITSYTVGGKRINIAGTSASVQAGAVAWATVKSAKPNLTYSEIYNLFVKTSTQIKNSKVTGGVLMNMDLAVNG